MLNVMGGQFTKMNGKVTLQYQKLQEVLAKLAPSR
jgi:hypothetical protein